ncbi:MAG: Lrp/AsnC family transcriptional regulator [Oceanospirillaceae bacterium]|nr:Lrp/AsnC family transcriptional regulator [Oceanospirillaceae bacterium]
MDKFDQAIIQALKKDARQSISNIAEQVNLSRSSVTARIKNLEQKKIIRGYQVLLSESQKTAVSAYFEIKNVSVCCEDLMAIFNQMPEVVTCHGITGEMDLLMFVKAPSMQRLHEIREFIDSHDGIAKIKTHVVMSEWINNRGH